MKFCKNSVFMCKISLRLGFLGRCRDPPPHIVRSVRRPNRYEKSN
nr:MAG TPA: hypothetical protein [Bacteriophage sp.]